MNKYGALTVHKANASRVPHTLGSMPGVRPEGLAGTLLHEG